MTVSLTWVSPVAAGALDKTTGDVLTEGWMDAVVSDLLVLGGSGGLTHTGAYTITGTAGVGNTAVATQMLAVSGGITSGTNQFGIYSNPISSTAATNETSAFVGQPQTVASSYTASIVSAFHAMPPTRGAGSTITQAFGVLVDAINTGGTTNYGIYINAPSGGSSENLGIKNLGSAQLNGSGTSVAFFGGTPVAIQTIGNNGTDLATIITLCNNIRLALRAYNMVN